MKTLKTQVAIAGAGASGMAAALACGQLGLSVIIFEKSGKYGGPIGGGKGPFGVETIQQRRLQRVVTRAEAFKYFMDYSHWRANPQLVAAYVNKSPDTINWLEKIGCEFDSLNAYVEGGNHTWHAYDDSEFSICDRIWKESEKYDIQMFLNSPVRKLIKENGIIKGLITEQDGCEVCVKADAVIIATGGFGNNAEMVEKYTPYTLGKTVCAMTQNCDGDGIKMAWEAGGSKGFMFYDAFAGLPHPTLGGPGGFCAELRSFRQPNLLINQFGKRFTDETAMLNGAYGINVIRQQPGNYAYMIITDEILDFYKKDGFPIALPSRDPFTGQFEDWPKDFEEKMEEVMTNNMSPDLFMADSLEEIAKWMDVNWEIFKITVDDYNKICESGEDDLFHKRRKFLRPICGKKYYVARLSANSYATLGGININEKAEVVDDEQRAIKGLYAVGNDANTICVDSYCFEMPGHTSGFAFNTGRLAAEYANEYINNL